MISQTTNRILDNESTTFVTELGSMVSRIFTSYLRIEGENYPHFTPNTLQCVRLTRKIAMRKDTLAVWRDLQNCGNVRLRAKLNYDSTN